MFRVANDEHTVYLFVHGDFLSLEYWDLMQSKAGMSAVLWCIPFPLWRGREVIIPIFNNTYVSENSYNHLWSLYRAQLLKAVLSISPAKIVPLTCWQLSPFQVTEFDINVEKDIGELLLVRLTMERYLNFLLDDWFCQYVNVTSPSGQLYQFPFYQWISKPGSVEVPEGKGKTCYLIFCGTVLHPCLLRLMWRWQTPLWVLILYHPAHLLLSH